MIPTVNMVQIGATKIVHSSHQVTLHGKEVTEKRRIRIG